MKAAACLCLVCRRLTECSREYLCVIKKKVREKSRECHNHKPQPFPDIKLKRKPANPNKHKSIKRTKSTKISSLFPITLSDPWTELGAFIFYVFINT